jgi:hypothetical protein
MTLFSKFKSSKRSMHPVLHFQFRDYTGWAQKTKSKPDFLISRGGKKPPEPDLLISRGVKKKPIYAQIRELTMADF